jgi:hypothetical protein
MVIHIARVFDVLAIFSNVITITGNVWIFGRRCASASASAQPRQSRVHIKDSSLGVHVVHPDVVHRASSGQHSHAQDKHCSF